MVVAVLVCSFFVMGCLLVCYGAHVLHACRYLNSYKKRKPAQLNATKNRLCKEKVIIATFHTKFWESVEPTWKENMVGENFLFVSLYLSYIHHCWAHTREDNMAHVETVLAVWAWSSRCNAALTSPVNQPAPRKKETPGFCVMHRESKGVRMNGWQSGTNSRRMSGIKLFGTYFL